MEKSKYQFLSLGLMIVTLFVMIATLVAILYFNLSGPAPSTDIYLSSWSDGSSEIPEELGYSLVNNGDGKASNPTVRFDFPIDGVKIIDIDAYWKEGNIIAGGKNSVFVKLKWESLRAGESVTVNISLKSEVWDLQYYQILPRRIVVWTDEEGKAVTREISQPIREQQIRG